MYFNFKGVKIKQEIFDYCVVGLGVAGAFTTYYLNQNTKAKVLLIDSNGVGNGGSGSAGAFINPKFNKKGELAELINEAFTFAIDFYKNNFPKLFAQKGTLYDSNFIKEVELFENKNISSNYNFCEKSGFITDVQELLSKLIKSEQNIFLKEEIININFDKKSQLWTLNNNLKIKNLIVTTGAYPLLKNFEEHINIRPVWGQRIDVSTSSAKNIAILEKFNKTIHQKISISAIENNTFKVGATHQQHVLHQEIDHQKNLDLLESAKAIFNSLSLDLDDDFFITKTYGGARSGSFDYFPLVGKVVDSKESINSFPNLVNGKKIEFDKLIYHENLYILSGLGGYGFVLSPLLAKKLVETSILKEQFLEKNLENYRFFLRWIKKQKIKNLS